MLLILKNNKCLNFISIQVHVNDKYFTEFNHRGGVNDASHFNIVGNLDIQDVEYFEPLVSTHRSKPSPLENETKTILTVSGFESVRWKHFLCVSGR